MASDNNDNQGRKPRSYYVDYSRGNNRYRDSRRAPTKAFSGNARYKEAPEISFGLRGFLITSVDEVKSYLEMRNVLEGYFEKLYKPKVDEVEKRVETTTEDEVEAELKQLRTTRPFKQVKTNCRNTLFIKIMQEFPQIDPIVVVDNFFNDLLEKHALMTTNTYKVLPVLDTFRNSTACAKESISNLIQKLFADDPNPKKYFIEFQSRGNYKLNPEDKQKMIEGVANSVAEVKPDWSVSREEADYIIVLVALRNVCAISFLKHYFKRFRYNVIELCKDFAPDQELTKPSEDAFDKGPSSEGPENNSNED